VLRGKVPGRLVVGFDDESALRPVTDLVRRVDATLRFAVLDAATDDLAARVAHDLAGQPGVRYVEPECEVRAALLPDDPYFLSYQWDKWVMYADEAWDVTTGQSSVKVGIVDNGVDFTHPDLAANFRTGQYGYDFVDDDADPRPANTANPESFHGTHVAGIAGAVINNGVGVAGWARCQLVAVRVLNDSGSGVTSDLASGIRWAADFGCKVVNMSLTAPSAPTDVVEACEYAAARGCLLVAASGNEGASSVGYPAGLARVIAVGATGPDSRLASYSNHGAKQELVAAGTGISSTAPENGYVEASGTSMAAPQVAGVAALVWSTDQSLTATRVRALLDASAVDMGAEGRDSYYGYGLVNARRALDLAAASRQDGLPVSPGWPSGSLVVRGECRLPAAATATVYDACGRTVATATGQRSIALEPGTYFLRLAQGGRTGTHKLVVR
jgi:subtilisin family serine protease